MHTFLEGFFLQASLILALGAQNLFVLESGLKKQRHLLVATICSLCDTLLIAVGVLGAASLFVRVPFLKAGFGILGVAFLAYYGLVKLNEGIRGAAKEFSSTSLTSSTKKVVMLSLSFSLLNPHVYLDTVILVGGYSAKFPALAERAEFGGGAASFSVIWFFGLAYFGSFFSAWMKNPRAMRTISLISGIILLVLAAKLGVDVYQWVVPLLA